jgi:hypothetical protein
MIRITFAKGRYRVQALNEPARRWLSEYASDRVSIPRIDDGIIIDPRFLADLLDCAKSVGLQVERE